MSRHHATIQPIESHHQIRDHSAKGTVVSGQRIENVALPFWPA
ncbi:MAG: FHA domain-containing protein [Candidatus Binataceae bacterium]